MAFGGGAVRRFYVFVSYLNYFCAALTLFVLAIDPSFTEFGKLVFFLAAGSLMLAAARQ